MPVDKLHSEDVIRALVGGAAPSVGDTIVFTEIGWVFKAADDSESTNHDERYYTKDEVDAIIAGLP